MVRTNMNQRRVKPESSALLTLHVLRRQQLSPHFVRVTLGGGDIEQFVHRGHDQWFRLFLPVTDTSLSHAPAKLTTLAYLRFLTVSSTERPVLRNYTVRAFRAHGPDGPELDVDFVLHGSADDGTAGPAAAWAQRCEPGDAVGIIDEGTTFHPPPDTTSVRLVADETGLPAVAGVLASLADDVVGHAVVEVPTAADAQPLTGPPGVEVSWVFRDTTDAAAVPGVAALARSAALPRPEPGCFGWVVGESGLATGQRRVWVDQGLDKSAITFCGYWKAGRQH